MFGDTYYSKIVLQITTLKPYVTSNSTFDTSKINIIH